MKRFFNWDFHYSVIPSVTSLYVSRLFVNSRFVITRFHCTYNNDVTFAVSDFRTKSLFGLNKKRDSNNVRRASEPPKPIPGLAKSPNTLKALVEEDKIIRQKTGDTKSPLLMTNGIASKSPSNEIIMEEDEEEQQQQWETRVLFVDFIPYSL